MNSPLTNPLVIKALELGATLLSQPCECVALAKKETTVQLDSIPCEVCGRCGCELEHDEDIPTNEEAWDGVCLWIDPEYREMCGAATSGGTRCSAHREHTTAGGEHYVVGW